MKKFSVILICSSCLFLLSACGVDGSTDPLADTEIPDTITSDKIIDETVASIVDAEAFSDSNFADCIINAIENSESEITQLADITILECENLEISNVNGVELLTGLYELRLSENQITSIDVSNNWHLKVLDMEVNQLETIDVSNNPNLEYLNLNDNLLTEIDVTLNTSLKGLYLKNNQLLTLDLSNNTLLTALDVSGNADELRIYN